MNDQTAFVVKLGNRYVAFPHSASYGDRKDESEWTDVQQYAWRWVGLESGNGARLKARNIGNGARVVRLRKRKRPTSDQSGKP